MMEFSLFKLISSALKKHFNSSTNPFGSILIILIPHAINKHTQLKHSSLSSTKEIINSLFTANASPSQESPTTFELLIDIKFPNSNEN